jgi:pimeloyl-ACP methyl ester carboxylesterase
MIVAVLLGLLWRTGATTEIDLSDPLPPARVPIVFVHGTGMSSATWTELIDALVAEGYAREDLLALDLEPRDGSNVQAAERLIAPAVEELLAQAAVRAQRSGNAPPGKVDLIAHSMGAVSTRWYAAFVRPERVRLWLGIAGANHGTNALCGYPGEGDRELCPAFATAPQDSPVLTALNGTPDAPRDESPFGLGTDAENVAAIPATQNACIAYFTVRIEPDEWIEPERSALLAGAGGLDTKSLKVRRFKQTEAGNFLFKGAAFHDDLPKRGPLTAFVQKLLAIADEDYARACTGRS